ncbi:wsc domain-containing protein [Colletotrichum truncatum]|uniref:Wsc domain-containing protein n=1 Tax=Colletotrichum truncatum TaxID=5467 RepID=A0ACC3YST8_COLTU
MRLPSLSTPSRRQNQTTIVVGLVILALWTAFAVSQAVHPLRDRNNVGTIDKRHDNLERRQMFGLPGLPVGIFGGGQPASVPHPGPPATDTTLPLAAPAAPNSQNGPLGLGGLLGQTIPTGVVQVVAPLAPILGEMGGPPASAVNPGNIVPSVVNVIPVQSLLPVGGVPVIPIAITDGQGSQTAVNDGLPNPIQSIVDVGGNVGSIIPSVLGGFTGISNPVASQAAGGLPVPVGAVTAALGNGDIITNIPPGLAGIVSSIVNGLPPTITAPAALFSPVPIGLSAPLVDPIISSLNNVQPISVVMPLSSALPVNLSGLNAPQLPGSLGNILASVTGAAGTIVTAVGQAAEVIPGSGSVASSASVTMDLTQGSMCTVVNIANGIPTFIVTPCSSTAPTPLQTTASQGSISTSPIAITTTASSVGPITSSAQPQDSNSGNVPLPPQTTAITSQVVPVTTTPVSVKPSAIMSAGGSDTTASSSAEASQNNSNGQPQNTRGAAQPPSQPQNPVSARPPANSPLPGSGSIVSQSGGAAPDPASTPAHAVTPFTTITVAGPPASPPAGAPSNGSGGQGAPPTPPSGGIFGVGEDQNPASGLYNAKHAQYLPPSHLQALRLAQVEDTHAQNVLMVGSAPLKRHQCNLHPAAWAGLVIIVKAVVIIIKTVTAFVVSQPTTAPDSGNPGSGSRNGNPSNVGPANSATTLCSSAKPSQPTSNGNGPGSGKPLAADPSTGSGNGPSNSAPPGTVVPKAAPDVSGWKLLGCFKDSPIRTLDCDPSNYFAGNMSNEKCVAHCSSKGFKLAGTEYGKECWCGNAFQIAERLPQEQCNEVCDGCPTEFCGGNWAVTVYSADGQAMNVPSDDDTSNGTGDGAGGTGNPETGNPSSPPQGNSPTKPPVTTTQTPSQDSTKPPAPTQQSSLAPARGQPTTGIPTSAKPIELSQADVLALLQSIINSLPKGSPSGGYGGGLGARGSGAGGNAAPGNGNGGLPDLGSLMGPGPVIPLAGLTEYGPGKRAVPSRSMKRSRIIGRALAGRDVLDCVEGADGNDEDCVGAKF